MSKKPTKSTGKTSASKAKADYRPSFLPPQPQAKPAVKAKPDKSVVTADADTKAQAKPTPKALAKASRKAKAAAAAKIAKLELETLTVAAFQAAGFKNIVPRKTVLTLRLWGERGMKAINGQQPVWVKAPWHSERQIGYPMFHRDQVEPIQAAMSRDNLDENGATIWMRRCGRERAHDCRRPQLWQGR